MDKLHVTPNIRILVYQKVVECVALLRKHYNVKLHRPKILFTKKGTVAGVANSTNWLVNFNPTLLNENTDEFIKNTVPHEVCHLAADIVAPGESTHGPMWQQMMRLFGLSPEARHRYDVTNSRINRTVTQYRYRCDCCDKTFDVGTRRHAALQSEPGAYTHGPCGEKGTLEYVSPIVTIPTAAKSYSEEDRFSIQECYRIFKHSVGIPKDEVIDMFMRATQCTRQRAMTTYTVCSMWALTMASP